MRESEVQELSMVLSEEDTSVRNVAETDVPQKTDSEKENPDKREKDVFEKEKVCSSLILAEFLGFSLIFPLNRTP